MLPADLDFAVSELSELQFLDQEPRLSQQVEDYSLTDNRRSAQQATPDTTIQTESNNSKRKK